MKRLAHGVLAFVLRSQKRILKSSKTVQKLLRQEHSTTLFTDLRRHDGMLADAARVETYRKGLRRNIKAGTTVLDLGTGRGILSLLAAQSRPKKVSAIDRAVSGF